MQTRRQDPNSMPTLLMEELEEMLERHRSEVRRCIAHWHDPAKSEVPHSSHEPCDVKGNTQSSGSEDELVPHVPAEWHEDDAYDEHRILEKRPAMLDMVSHVEPMTAVTASPNVCAELRSTAQPEEACIEDQNPLASMILDATSDQWKILRERSYSKRIRMTQSAPNLGQGQLCIQRLVHRHCYENVNCSVVVMNAIFIGIQTQMVATASIDVASGGSGLHPRQEYVFFGIQGFFAFVFTVDLALRWIAAGLVQFWMQDDVAWNVLDGFVVLSGLFDIVVQGLVLSDTSKDDVSLGGNFSVLRLLRTLRIVRVARVIRVLRFFRELRLMMASILGSAKSLMWSIVIVFMLLYVVGITYTTAASYDLRSGERDAKDRDVVAYFGTLDASILSLFKSMTGGADWEQFYSALQKLGHPWDWSFLAFVTVALFAVFNVVTGVFVNNAMRASSTDETVVVQEEMDRMSDKETLLLALFQTLDPDGSGNLSKDDFETHVAHPDVAAFFQSIHLQASDTKLLFDLLDRDRSGTVSVQEFVSGCYSLVGEATSFDAKVLRIEVNAIRQALSTIETLLRGGGANTNLRTI